MGRDSNVGRQGIMNGSLTQAGPPEQINYLLFIVRQTNVQYCMEGLKNYNPSSKFIFLWDGIFCLGIYETQI